MFQHWLHACTVIIKSNQTLFIERLENNNAECLARLKGLMNSKKVCLIDLIVWEVESSEAKTHRK